MAAATTKEPPKSVSDEPISLSLTERMRARTKETHDKSDSLVNLKLALVLTSPPLYGEAIALFWPVFSTIEDIIDKADNGELKKIQSVLPVLRRTPGLWKDMEYYLTSDRRKELEGQFKGSIPMKNLAQIEYLKRLRYLAKEDPILVISYAYHLWAGTLMGGQIIKRMVRKAMGLKNRPDNEGVEIYCLQDEGTNVLDVRKTLAEAKRIINDELELTAEEQERLIQESLRVFQLNNTLIKTIDETQAWKNAKHSASNFALKVSSGLIAVVGLVLAVWRFL